MADDAVAKLKKLQVEAEDALDDARLARREEHQISRWQVFLHFWALVARSFVRNRCPLRASGLTYASLLAMVPMLAVVISVSASLLKTQGEEPIRKFIDAMVERLTPDAGSLQFTSPLPPELREGMEGVAEAPAATPGGGLLDAEEYEKTRREMTAKINAFIGNIQSGTMGVTGMLALLFVAIGMLSRIEDTFNDIWGVSRGRSWFTRIVQYWGALTLGPIVLAVTFTLTSGPYFEATRDFVAGMGQVGVLTVKVGMGMLPYAIWTLTFALFYQLMPNTRVRWRAALVGGAVGGCLWQLNSEFSVLYVSRVVTNSRIYGSLGMVPVFMIGLYMAWVILLFGAQVAYAFQNRRVYLQEKQAESVHQRGREFVALRLMAQVGLRFHQGGKAPTLTELSESIGVPTRLVIQLARTLVQLKLLAEVAEAESAYVPARPLGQITVRDVIEAIRVGAGMELCTREDGLRDVVHDVFRRVNEAENRAASEVTLQDLVDRLGTRPGGGEATGAARGGEAA